MSKYREHKYYNTNSIVLSTNGNPTNTTARSIYFTKDNLDKIDRIRGSTIKRATVINKMIEHLDEDWIKSVLQ